MITFGNEKQVTIEGFTLLAPMAGVADRAVREISTALGCPYTVGEMASSKGVVQHNEKSRQLLQVDTTGRPAAVQLFGDDPAIMAEAARAALEFHPAALDINMGCPAPKVAGNGGGSALMKNPPLAAAIVEAVARATPLPVTVKIRKGWDDHSINAVDFARRMEAAGASLITVHGRTRAQMYAPPVDLAIIAAVKRAVKVPVIGNGDVTTPEEAKAMVEATGCDGVMIGRGALGNPWLFRRAEALLSGRPVPPAPPLAERLEVMRRQIGLLLEYKGEYIGLREARRQVGWFMAGLRGAAALRRGCGQISSLGDIDRLAEEALSLNPGL